MTTFSRISSLSDSEEKSFNLKRTMYVTISAKEKHRLNMVKIQLPSE